MSERLGREVRRRRSELQLSQAALASRGSLSLATLGAIERGQPRAYTATTLAALDKVLGWEIGHAQRVIDEQRAEDAAPVSGTTDVMMRLLADYRSALEDMHREPTWAEELVTLAGTLTPDDVSLVMALMRRLATAHQRRR